MFYLLNWFYWFFEFVWFIAFVGGIEFFHSTFDPPEADKCLLASGEFDVQVFPPSPVPSRP